MSGWCYLHSSSATVPLKTKKERMKVFEGKSKKRGEIQLGYVGHKKNNLSSTLYARRPHRSWSSASKYINKIRQHKTSNLPYASSRYLIPLLSMPHRKLFNFKLDTMATWTSQEKKRIWIVLILNLDPLLPFFLTFPISFTSFLFCFLSFFPSSFATLFPYFLTFLF